MGRHSPRHDERIIAFRVIFAPWEVVLATVPLENPQRSERTQIILLS